MSIRDLIVFTTGAAFGAMIPCVSGWKEAASMFTLVLATLWLGGAWRNLHGMFKRREDDNGVGMGD